MTPIDAEISDSKGVAVGKEAQAHTQDVDVIIKSSDLERYISERVQKRQDELADAITEIRIVLATLCLQVRLIWILMLLWLGATILVSYAVLRYLPSLLPPPL